MGRKVPNTTLSSISIFTIDLIVQQLTNLQLNPLRHLGMFRGDGDGSMVRTWLRKRDDWFTGSREL